MEMMEMMEMMEKKVDLQHLEVYTQQAKIIML
jgi:hypothetical protein